MRCSRTRCWRVVVRTDVAAVIVNGNPKYLAALNPSLINMVSDYSALASRLGPERDARDGRLLLWQEKKSNRRIEPFTKEDDN